VAKLTEDAAERLRTLQRGRRLETTESSELATHLAAVPGSLQRGRRLETTESQVGDLCLGDGVGRASTGPSSGDDGEGAPRGGRRGRRRARFNGAVVWRRRRGADASAREARGHPHASTGPSSGDDGEALQHAEHGVGHPDASTGPSSGDDGERRAAGSAARAT